MKALGWVAVAVTVGVMLGGCGASGAQSADSADERASQAQEAQAEARQRAAEKKKAEQSAIYEECRKVAGDLNERLTELDSRLSVGLQFADYGKAVGSAKVAYDKLIRDAKKQGGVSEPCINKVGLPLEKALTAYMTAYDVWNGCFDSYSCDFDEGSTELKKAQTQWAKASRFVARADDGLAKLQPAP